MSKRILINSSNLHNGGGVQVATSIIRELSLSSSQANITLALSSTVLRECEKIGTDMNCFRDLEVVDVRGFDPINPILDQLIQGADVVFTVFGPLYSLRRPKKSIVGFAQPWIIYPKSDAHYKLPLQERLKVSVRYFLQKLAFVRNSDILVVEAEHVRERLKTILPRAPAVVVPNALNAVFCEAIANTSGAAPTIARASAISAQTNKITLGYVGRAYSHKNVDILPEVRKALRERHGIDATIKVTLNDSEWADQSEEFRKEIENVGSMSLGELVEFYRSLDGIIFPSLLECFSATPLEAMAMGLPLFASNRAFVRDFCEGYPFYFDPLDPESIADAVARSFKLPRDELIARLREGKCHVLSLPTATDRAKKVVDLLNSL